MEPIKFVSPSSFFYWEKCPLKAVYSKEFRDPQIFPKHPDADLGSIIHAFFEKKTEWNISSAEAFEEKWEEEINRLDEAYKQSAIQKIYFPIKWNAKYFAVKKILLKKSLLKKFELPANAIHKNIKFEQWIDDGNDIGGKVDHMIFNDQNEIVEIVDFKTGNIFEFKEKRKAIKMAYIQQLILYAYVIKKKQIFYPKCFIHDIKGNKYKVEIKEEFVSEIYKSAIELKTKINRQIDEGNIDQLANPCVENCSYCDYRPICKKYKENFVNNFENKYVDIFGVVVEMNGSKKAELKIKIENKTIILKGIRAVDNIKIGDAIFVYNLFCPDGNSQILFAMKETIIKHE
jgi:hypothetical protein